VQRLRRAEPVLGASAERQSRAVSIGASRHGMARNVQAGLGVMRDLAAIFKALSDETRLEILALLDKLEELCVCDILDLLEITQSKASRHLRHLVQAGLLEDRRDGTWVHYRIVSNPEALHGQAMGLLRALLRERIPPDLDSMIEAWIAEDRQPCSPS